MHGCDNDYVTGEDRISMSLLESIMFIINYPSSSGFAH
jgi:hypothetical protein